MTATTDYLEWRRQSHVGCVFARLMSDVPDDFAQKVEELPSGAALAHVAAAISTRIDALVADSKVVAAALLLPGIKTLEHLTTMALALGNHPNWAVTTTKLQNPIAGDMVAIHIVRQIPFGNNTCPSEALVLGPYPEFPATRRAPVTALEIFVGEPLPQDPKTHQPTTKANLAHIDMLDRNLVKRDLDGPTIDMMWKTSKSGRTKSLGGVDDNRAKAKVSFVIPLALAQQLGCAP